MTTDSSLGSRWVAALGDKAWAPGMRASNTKFARVLALSGDAGDPEPVCASEEGATADDCYAAWFAYKGATPDTNDAATLGAMLGIVRGLWEEPTATPMLNRDGWYLKARVPESDDYDLWITTAVSDSEEACLVLAAEAWKRGGAKAPRSPR